MIKKRIDKRGELRDEDQIDEQDRKEQSEAETSEGRLHRRHQPANIHANIRRESWCPQRSSRFPSPVSQDPRQRGATYTSIVRCNW